MNLNLFVTDSIIDNWCLLHVVADLLLCSGKEGGGDKNKDGAGTKDGKVG